MMLAIVFAARWSASLDPCRVDPQRGDPTATVSQPAGDGPDVDACRDQLRRGVMPEGMEPSAT